MPSPLDVSFDSFLAQVLEFKKNHINSSHLFCAEEKIELLKNYINFYTKIDDYLTPEERVIIENGINAQNEIKAAKQAAKDKIKTAEESSKAELENQPQEADSINRQLIESKLNINRELFNLILQKSKPLLAAHKIESNRWLYRKAINKLNTPEFFQKVKDLNPGKVKQIDSIQHQWQMASRFAALSSPTLLKLTEVVTQFEVYGNLISESLSALELKNAVNPSEYQALNSLSNHLNSLIKDARQEIAQGMLARLVLVSGDRLDEIKNKSNYQIPYDGNNDLIYDAPVLNKLDVNNEPISDTLVLNTMDVNNEPIYDDLVLNTMEHSHLTANYLNELKQKLSPRKSLTDQLVLKFNKFIVSNDSDDQKNRLCEIFSSDTIPIGDGQAYVRRLEPDMDGSFILLKGKHFQSIPDLSTSKDLSISTTRLETLDTLHRIINEFQIVSPEKLEETIESFEIIFKPDELKKINQFTRLYYLDESIFKRHLIKIIHEKQSITCDDEIFFEARQNALEDMKNIAQNNIAHPQPANDAVLEEPFQLVLEEPQLNLLRAFKIEPNDPDFMNELNLRLQNNEDENSEKNIYQHIIAIIVARYAEVFLKENDFNIALQDEFLSIAQNKVAQHKHLSPEHLKPEELSIFLQETADFFQQKIISIDDNLTAIEQLENLSGLIADDNFSSLRDKIVTHVRESLAQSAELELNDNQHDFNHKSSELENKIKLATRSFRISIWFAQFLAEEKTRIEQSRTGCFGFFQSKRKTDEKIAAINAELNDLIDHAHELSVDILISRVNQLLQNKSITQSRSIFGPFAFFNQTKIILKVIQKKLNTMNDDALIRKIA